MKLISFIIPAYNSESYINQAIDSLLVEKEEIEIIIVNDGSKDQTSSIAHNYQMRFPSIVSVIDQENAGHGGAINTGLKHAKGKFFKVIDSDDWVDHDSLLRLIETIKEHESKDLTIDLYLTNFVYEHVSDNTQYERDYSENFPINKIFNWNQVKKKFKYSKTLLMHALIYRTEVLRQIGFELPKHTFYVDNLLSYIPLPYVKNLYYMKTPFYRYFIGRSNQSITFKNITSRYQQQILVQSIMTKAYPLNLIDQFPKGLRQYMKHNLSAIMTITQMFTVAETSLERKEHLYNLWKDIKKHDKEMYRFLRYKSLNTWVNFLPWAIRRFVMIKGYFYLVKKVKLG